MSTRRVAASRSQLANASCGGGERGSPPGADVTTVYVCAGEGTCGTFTRMDRVKARRTGYTRLSPKHQVTIPARVVVETGVEVGTEFAVSAESDGRIVLHPVDDLRARRLRAIDQTAGSLKGVWRPGDLDRLRDEWR